MNYYVGIDLGGSNIAAGVVDEAFQIISYETVKTKPFRPAEQICDDMALLAHKAVAGAGLQMQEIAWVGIGSPGTVNRKTGIVGVSHNLGFLHTPLRALMEERLQTVVYIENDANTAAYAEAKVGCAQGLENILAITLGTGVGGGLILDGRLYSGSQGAGGELGHMGIVKDGWPCSCGRRGCLEAYASASGLIKMTQQALKDYPQSLMHQMLGEGKKISGRTAFCAFRAKDQAAQEVVGKYVEYLAYGLVNYSNIFAPEAIVVGGGIGREGELLLDLLRNSMRKELAGSLASLPKLLCARLGNEAGIIGAALLGNLDA